MEEEMDEIQKWLEWEGETAMTVTIPNFTNETVHLQAQEIDTEYSAELTRFRIDLVNIFANGFSENTWGHVCILYFIFKPHIELCCTISVIDNLGNQRFPQSFIITYMMNEEDKVISYISRETLLSDSNELLPGDTLTLTISMHFRSIYKALLNDGLLKSSRRLGFLKVNVDFNSELMMFFKEETTYFLEITMPEDNDMFDKRKYFHKIKNIFETSYFFVFQSVKEIFNLYILADKCEIPTVIESCRGFLKLCLFDHTIDDYSEFSNEYENGDLRELIRAEIDEVSSTNLDEETEWSRNGVYLKEPIRERQWLYHYGNRNVPLYFQDINYAGMLYYDRNHTETFDFYR